MSTAPPAGWSASLRERLLALAAGELEVAATRDAATVVLLRDAPRPRPDGARLEVFMLRRVSTMAFAANQYVFPGGKVDAHDDLPPGELPPGVAGVLTGGDEPMARRLLAAAIRETLEEAGVRLRAADLWPLAHWITPEAEPRRYDTRFLLAALPAGQVAAFADGESDDGVWVDPGQASHLALMPPTVAALAQVAPYPDVAAAMAALARLRPLQAVLPRFEIDGDGVRMLLPAGPDGPAPQPPAAGGR